MLASVTTTIELPFTGKPWSACGERVPLLLANVKSRMASSGNGLVMTRSSLLPLSV